MPNPEPVFKNTQEAIAYGENARASQSPEQMVKLLEKITIILTQYLVNTSFNIQNV